MSKQKIIAVMTGLSMVNAGVTTQLTLSLFNIKGVVHVGASGNANPNLQIGDVTIPKYWAHAGLWNWQRYRGGPNDTLAFEESGDYTRDIGYLEFDDYNSGCTCTESNLLNRVWFQPEEIFPIDGQPEFRQHALWISADQYYLTMAEKLEDLVLTSCVESNCLSSREAMVVLVERGISAAMFVDNKAYGELLYNKFNATTIDMEAAAVALISLQQKLPFIAIRGISHLAGGGDALPKEADIEYAFYNAIYVCIEFLSLVSLSETQNVY